jgi:hypothetical protein
MFIDEIHEYIKDTLADGDWNDEQCLKDLIREINRSRFNYNIAIDEVTKHIFMEFMNQPRFGPSLDEMKTVMTLIDCLIFSNFRLQTDGTIFGRVITSSLKIRFKFYMQLKNTPAETTSGSNMRQNTSTFYTMIWIF